MARQSLRSPGLLSSRLGGVQELKSHKREFFKSEVVRGNGVCVLAGAGEGSGSKLKARIHCIETSSSIIISIFEDCYLMFASNNCCVG